MCHLVQFSQMQQKLSIVQACLGICSHFLWNHSSHQSHATIVSSSNIIVCSDKKLVPFRHVLLSWHTSLLISIFLFGVKKVLGFNFFLTRTIVLLGILKILRKYWMGVQNILGYIYYAGIPKLSDVIFPMTLVKNIITF